MAEPPYGIITDLLKKGQVVPFLGAGASFSARPLDSIWNQPRSTFLPSGSELAHWLADDASFPSPEPAERDDLAKVASYYVASVDRPDLLSRLREVFDRDYQVGEVHRFLAELPEPMLIVTTNYDDLIQRAFQSAGKPFHLVVHPTEQHELAASVLVWKPGDSTPTACPPNELSLSPKKDGTIIYKMHGSVDRQAKNWDSFVITEEDYVEFLSRMTGRRAVPARFLVHFRQCHFLFLGYGLRDWNLRVMLNSLRSMRARTPDDAVGSELPELLPEGALGSWAIQYRPTELEETLWRARKVNIYDVEIDKFVAKLRSRLKDDEAPSPTNRVAV